MRKTNTGKRKIRLGAVALFAVAATIGTTAYATDAEQPMTSVNDVEAALSAEGFVGTIEGVPGLLVFVGTVPDAEVGQVTMSRWEGTPADYAKTFLEYRTNGMEEKGWEPQATAVLFDGAAYGSSGDVPFAMEWAAVQQGDETILVMRPKAEDSAWVGSRLIDLISAHVPALETAGFDLTVTEAFEGPGQ